MTVRDVAANGHRGCMDDEDIPPLKSPEEMEPVRTDADLRERWRSLMGRLGFGGYSLWLNLVDADGRMTPVLTQIEELDAPPDEIGLDNLMRMCRHLVDEFAPGGRVAFLLTRPGSAGLTDWDRAWGNALLQGARRHAVPLWPVHRANDEVLRVMAPDDLSGELARPA